MTTMQNYKGLHEDDTNSTYCEKCGCRITGGQCKHGVRATIAKRCNITGFTMRLFNIIWIEVVYKPFVFAIYKKDNRTLIKRFEV